MLSGAGLTISVASGKGGTGKTTIAVSLAAALKECAYLDCDVEEPNGAFFLNPVINKKIPSVKRLPVIDRVKCTNCGLCALKCRLNALIDIKTDIILLDKLCHSCGVCSAVCRQGAISEKDIRTGEIREGVSADGIIRFADGTLDIGQEMATPLIKNVKARTDRNKINIIDCPPGTSCLMVEAVKDSDFVILVTEPSPFGLHDLKLAVEVLRCLNLPFGVIINKYESSFPDLESYLEKEQIITLMKIPFDKKSAEAYSAGRLSEIFPEEVIRRFHDMYVEINMFLNKLVPLN